MASRTSTFTGPAGITTAAGSELNYLGTLRARLGLVASERLMIYATGGLAYGNPDNSAAVATATGALWGGGSDATRFGYTIGAGAEYALTNNWTAKIGIPLLRSGSSDGHRCSFERSSNCSARRDRAIRLASRIPAPSFALVSNYKF